MQNKVITIEKTEMQIREYAGQRVVTFKDIDMVHGNKSGTAKSNFNRHKKHFIEGEDYILATREILKSDNLSLLNIDVPARGIILLTESGYLLIAKSFTDDLSWTVQRQLVNGYFKAKEMMQEQNEKPKVPEFDEFPELPSRPHWVSNTRLPRNPNWFDRNRRRMERICRKHGVTLSFLYHRILVYLGECFEMDGVREAYKKEVGHYPIYAMDIVQYFSELGDFADEYLDEIEKKK